MKKQYKISLDEDVVEKAQKLVLGAKLSPILNSLLQAWIEYREDVEKIVRRIKK